MKEAWLKIEQVGELKYKFTVTKQGANHSSNVVFTCYDNTVKNGTEQCKVFCQKKGLTLTRLG